MQNFKALWVCWGQDASASHRHSLVNSAGFVNDGGERFKKATKHSSGSSLFIFLFVCHLKAWSWGSNLVQLTSTSVLRDTIGIRRTPSVYHMSSGNGPKYADLGFMSGQFDLSLKQNVLCIQRTTVSCLCEEKNVSSDWNETFCLHYILLCLLNLLNRSWLQHPLANWIVSSC